MRLRVATYNVQGLRAGVGPVAEALEPERPDVVLVQECGTRRGVRRLATRLRMDFVSSHRLLHRVRNAVLFRPPWRLVEAETVDLTHRTRTRRRGLVAAHLRRTGVRLSAVSAHLGLSPRERERHAQELTDFLAGIQGPVVVGADLNEGPEGPAARWVGERCFDAFARSPQGTVETFPAAAPTVRIDYVFGNDALWIERAWVGATPAAGSASDHRPVFADLQIPEP